MAVELDEFPVIPKPPHTARATLYNWDQWFSSGKVWAMKEGEDFSVKLRVFRQQAANHARRHGYELKMRSDLLNRILYLQATKIEPKEKPKPKHSTPKVRIVRREDAPVPEQPKQIDPVSFVFGDRQEQDYQNGAPPRPQSTRAFGFGEKAKQEW